MPRKKKMYLPEELHMTEYDFIGDHPKGVQTVPKEDEPDDETWGMVTGQSGG
jgi:hypothetical protein